jgi:hypothetical protein
MMGFPMGFICLQIPRTQTSSESLSHCASNNFPLIQRQSIVAVHGLDGHWKDSWTADNGVFWLQDLLPHDFPKARIYSFGHDSRTRGGTKPLTLDISDHGKDLVTSLTNERYLSKVYPPILHNSLARLTNCYYRHKRDR